MIWLFLFLAVFLYGDVSSIILKIDKIESYKPVFRKIYLRECKKSEVKKVTKIKVVVKNKKNNIFKNKVLELKLLAIFNKKALINFKWVKEGDMIEGFKVLKIYSRKVVLQKDGKVVVLRFDNKLLGNMDR